jgi:hypothetical protein
MRCPQVCPAGGRAGLTPGRAAIKQYLIHLNETGKEGKFLDTELDATHVLVSNDIPRLVEILEAHVQDLTNGDATRGEKKRRRKPEA